MIDRPTILRHGENASRVSTVELFFDLVYVFAITQLAAVLEHDATPEGALHTAILLAIVWQVWIYTTWGTTFVDPHRLSVRAMLLVLMLGSLVLATAVPDAFGHETDRGMLLAIAFAVMQVGRAIWLVVVLRNEPAMRANFTRIMIWSSVSSALMIVGATTHGHARELMWIAAIAVEALGAAVGFRVPGMGHADTRDWTVMGAHFAERVQAFVLIALGESLVVTGAVLTDLDDPRFAEIAAFVAAFLGAVGFWWVYFDRAADESAELIKDHADPGRIARSAFHWVHPLLIGGIVVSAAADARVLHHPDGHGDLTTAWLVLGSTSLFLLGHAVFKAVVWRVASWPRIVTGVVLLALVPLGPHASPLVLGLCALAALVVVGVCDRLIAPGVSRG